MPTPSEELRAKFDKHLEHINSHDSKDLEFVLIICGHRIPGGKDNDIHVCQMAAGNVSLIADSVLDVTDALLANSSDMMVEMIAERLKAAQAEDELNQGTKH